MIPSDSIARFCVAGVLFACLGTNAVAQVESSEFGSLKFAPDLDQCRQALAQGNVLKVDGDTYYVTSTWPFLLFK